MYGKDWIDHQDWRRDALIGLQRPCVQCRHCYREDIDDDYRCRVRGKVGGSIDVVNGIEYADLADCNKRRSQDHHCGLTGKYFEPRPKVDA